MEEISGMTLTMKLKFIRNRAMFKVTNGTHKMVTLDPKVMLGIVALRSLGYHKIKTRCLTAKFELHVSF